MHDNLCQHVFIILTRNQRPYGSIFRDKPVHIGIRTVSVTNFKKWSVDTAKEAGAQRTKEEDSCVSMKCVPTASEKSSRRVKSKGSVHYARDQY